MITVDRHCATSIPGVFSGGDMVPSGRTLAESIGHGRRAAVAIEAYLEKRELPAAEKQAKASLDKLNTYYYEPVPQQKEARQGSEKRPQDFREVFATLSEEEAVREARRCFSCGRCFQCDTCYGVCPDNAICKGREAKDSENGLAFDYNYCKGCGLCARECPCGFLQMVPEER
jgi:Pyruvate/2-oxoacid:ferredoxin oxidoreductase delta subunit